MESSETSYVWEQMYSAVSSMITSDLDLRGRLLDAVSSRVSRVFDYSEEKPVGEIAIRLASLKNKLASKGSFKHTIYSLEDFEVREAVEEILSIFNLAARQTENNSDK